MNTATPCRQPTDIDAHVGTRIRAARNLKNLTQEKLAGCLGLTFQQIQKYESGRNRVSASRLFELARTFGVPVAYFYEGLLGETDGSERAETIASLNEIAGSRDGAELIRVFAGASPLHRTIILDVARSLTGGAP